MLKIEFDESCLSLPLLPMEINILLLSVSRALGLNKGHFSYLFDFLLPWGGDLSPGPVLNPPLGSLQEPSSISQSTSHLSDPPHALLVLTHWDLLWNELCPPPNSYIDTLTPNGMLSGGGTFEG